MTPDAARVADSSAAPRLRIAMVVGAFPVISETFVVNQVVGLLDQGHEVDIFTLSPRPARLDSVHPVVLERGLLERTRYAASRPKEGLAFLGAALRQLREMSKNHPSALPYLLDAFTYREDAYALRLLAMACMFAREPAYDVMHCQFGNLGRAMLALCDGGLFDGALVVSFRGSDISRFVQRRGPRVYDRLFQRGDGFFTNSRWFEQRLQKMGCDPARLEVLYSGIDLTRFPHRTRQRDASRPLRLITVGRLAEKKGVIYAVEAVARLHREALNFEYQIVGDGEQRPAIQALIKKRGLEGVVHLLGAKNQPEVIELLANADIFVAPNVRAANGDEEGPVNVIKEAFAMNLPVVATRHGGIPELVENGVSGWLVPEREPVALGERIGHMAQHPEEWPRMSQAARLHLERHFALDRQNDRLVDIYRRAIAHRHTVNLQSRKACTPIERPLSPS